MGRLLILILIIVVMIWACYEQVLQELVVESPMLGVSKAWFAAAMPVLAWELSVALWMIIKGFRTVAPAPLSAPVALERSFS